MVSSPNSDHSNQTWRYGKSIETTGIMKIAFSPNGKLLASSDSQGYGRLWDVSSGREVYTFSDEKVRLFGELLSFNEDGKILAGSAYFWDVATGKLVSRIGENATDILGAILAISPDLRTAASVFLPDKQIVTQVWDVETGRILCNLAGMSPFSFVLDSEQRVTKFSPNGRIITKVFQSADGDESLKLYEVSSGGEICSVDSGLGTCTGEISFSSDGKTLASIWASVSRKDHSILLSDVETGNKLCSISVDKLGKEHLRFAGFYPIAFSPDGHTLSVGLGQGQTGLWHLTSDGASFLKAKKVQILPGNTSEVMAVAFSPDGRTIASAGSDAIEFWHLV